MLGWTRRVKGARRLLFFLAFFLSTWLVAESQLGMPVSIHMVIGQARSLHTRLPVTVRVVGGGAVRHRSPAGPTPGAASVTTSQGQPIAITPTKLGQVKLDVRLFGVVPLRQRVVEVLPDVRVVPGGQAIGVLVASQGLIVSGITTVEGLDGTTTAPAREAGIKVGDLITHVNGRPVHTVSELERLVNLHGPEGNVTLKIKRAGEVLSLVVHPKQTAGRLGESRTDNEPRVSPPARERFRLGIFADDPACGVGTLSFFDSTSGIYGALGHMITDGVSKRGADISDGRIVPAIIAGVQPGLRGQPGEKIGVFQSQGPELGTIERNCEYGIFGRILRPPVEARDAVPLALADDVMPGPAQMLTVIEDQRVDRFDIEIVRVSRHGRRSPKSLVIRIADPALLSRTGGIIQGMSGSPILQRNKLAGIVTHVFVNDPTRGYGVLAEWMVEEAGLFEYYGTEKAQAMALSSLGPKEEKRGDRRMLI